MDLINQSPMKRVQTVMNLSAKTIVDEELYGKSINKYLGNLLGGRRSSKLTQFGIKNTFLNKILGTTDRGCNLENYEDEEDEEEETDFIGDFKATIPQIPIFKYEKDDYKLNPKDQYMFKQIVESPNYLAD